VIEYCGEVIDQEESDRRLAEMKLRGETNFYLFAVSPSHIIDAGQKGNLARFLNHACNPNCYSQRWSVNGRVRVGLFAKTHIAAGVELTYDCTCPNFVVFVQFFSIFLSYVCVMVLQITSKVFGHLVKSRHANVVRTIVV
jgi:hypothetical protein